MKEKSYVPCKPDQVKDIVFDLKVKKNNCQSQFYGFIIKVFAQEHEFSPQNPCKKFCLHCINL